MKVRKKRNTKDINEQKTAVNRENQQSQRLVIKNLIKLVSHKKTEQSIKLEKKNLQMLRIKREATLLILKF